MTPDGAQAETLMPHKRTWKLPMTPREAAAFMRAANSAHFRTVTFAFVDEAGRKHSVTATNDDAQTDGQVNGHANPWDEVLNEPDTQIRPRMDR